MERDVSIDIDSVVSGGKAESEPCVCPFESSLVKSGEESSGPISFTRETSLELLLLLFVSLCQSQPVLDGYSIPLPLEDKSKF